jgi:hypothetical protein
MELQHLCFFAKMAVIRPVHGLILNSFPFLTTPLEVIRFVQAGLLSMLALDSLKISFKL